MALQLVREGKGRHSGIVTVVQCAPLPAEESRCCRRPRAVAAGGSRQAFGSGWRDAAPLCYSSR